MAVEANLIACLLKSQGLKERVLLKNRSLCKVIYLIVRVSIVCSKYASQQAAKYVLQARQTVSLWKIQKL